MIIIRNISETPGIEDFKRTRKINSPNLAYIFKHKNDFKTLVRLNAWEISEITNALIAGGYDKYLTDMFRNLSHESFRILMEKQNNLN